MTDERRAGDEQRAGDGWALLAEYASAAAASLDLASLEMEGVPTLVRGLEPGIFGPGFTGATPHGIRVYVPESALADARELIGGEPVEDLEPDEWEPR